MDYLTQYHLQEHYKRRSFSLKFKGVVFRIDDDFKRQVASYGNEIKIDSEDHYRVGVPVKASEIKGLWKVKELVSAEKKRHLYDFIVKPVLLDNFTIGFQGHQGLEFYMKKNPQSHRLELIHLKTKGVIQLVKYVKPQEKKVDVLQLNRKKLFLVEYSTGRLIRICHLS